MADFLKWRMGFDGNDGAIVERKHASDPPGFEPASAREVLRSALPRPCSAEQLRALLSPECGMVAQVASSSPASKRSPDLLPAKQAALYNMATGQFKSIGFLCFMMWMSGTQIHLFSIMMTISGIYQPLMAVVNSRQGKWRPLMSAPLSV